MNRSNLSRLAVLSGLWLLWGAPNPVRATPIIVMDFDGISPSKSVKISKNYISSSNPNWDIVTAGVFNFDTDPSSPTDWGSFQAFCIELDQGLYNNATYSIVDLEDAPTIPNGREDLLRELWGTFRSAVVDAITAAAFQVSIWEIIYETSYSGPTSLNLDAGKFRMSGSYSSDSPAIKSQAKAWLDTLGRGIVGHTLDNYMVALINNYKQDQITSRPPPPQQEPVVPEPGSIALWSLGALGMFWVTRRQRALLAK